MLSWNSLPCFLKQLCLWVTVTYWVTPALSPILGFHLGAPEAHQRSGAFALWPQGLICYMNFSLIPSSAPVSEHKRNVNFDGATSSALICTWPRLSGINCCWLHSIKKTTGVRKLAIRFHFAIILSFSDGTKHLRDMCSEYICIFCKQYERFGADQGKWYDRDRQ